MILVTVEYSGAFVDKPSKVEFTIPDDTAAAERPLVNGQKDVLTALDLYKVYWRKNAYYRGGVEPEDQILPGHFEEWVRKKYLEKRNFYDKIISIEYSFVNG
jgi:hypothetical protein